MPTASSDPVLFADSVRALLDGRNFASVATLGPDGAPQNSVVWIKRDGDTVLFSSTDGRQKVRNLRRDPRISLSVFDLADPYTSVEIRGTAEILADEGKRLPYELSHKYLGIDPHAEKDDEVRVIIRIVPRRIVGFSA
ncbi:MULTISPECIES: PPOX class F420-dependent oxidoreductase [unclassified Streptomyces]|uniref:PPOX class F420-dependent oxidoreductase n=1 Tax=unclassified Streptomyces TaxID=2593676 RepID=UPI00224E601E|nr:MULTISPECIES: PPOX class F420-dependent oxidoreductase [unclassified Streptomyces]MCX4880025.1 PPOX class F420-dependent oxidoreductase [Streptomyces sp. NBC_00847]MCX5420021.1 PPOX class F420-dependent oxidoreductase [Streptomyces sp. NBC_00078]